MNALQEVINRFQYLPRSGSCATLLSPSRVLCFGGYVETAAKERQATNETLIFDMSVKEWTKIEPSNGPIPEPRLVSQIERTEDGSCWLICGWNSNQGGGGILNDIWQFFPNTNTWKQIQPQGFPVPAMSRHQACCIGGMKIIIHNHRCTDHVLLLDAGQQPPRLQKLPVQPDPKHGAPSSRGLHSMTAMDGNASLLIFGGASQQGTMCNDLWRLNLNETLQWQKLEPAGELPHVRCSHVAANVHNNLLLVIAGSYYKEDGSGLQALDDAWLYDSATNHWKEVIIQGDKPVGRNAAVMVPVGDGEFLYHGGWLAFQKTFNDTFLIRAAS